MLRLRVIACVVQICRSKVSVCCGRTSRHILNCDCRSSCTLMWRAHRINFCCFCFSFLLLHLSLPPSLSHPLSHPLYVSIPISISVLSFSFVLPLLVLVFAHSPRLRRWDEDVVFKNQARDEPAKKKRFINDTVRSDFHRKVTERSPDLSPHCSFRIPARVQLLATQWACR